MRENILNYFLTAVIPDILTQYRVQPFDLTLELKTEKKNHLSLKALTDLLLHI